MNKARHFKKKIVLKKEKKTDSIFKTARFSFVNIVKFAKSIKERITTGKIIDAKS